MPSFLSQFPSEAGRGLNIAELRRWLQELEAEVQQLKRAVDDIANEEQPADYEISARSVKIQSQSRMELVSSLATISAGQLTVNCASSRFTGIVQCDTIIATNVIGSNYTPGAGNVF